MWLCFFFLFYPCICFMSREAKVQRGILFSDGWTVLVNDLVISAHSRALPNFGEVVIIRFCSNFFRMLQATGCCVKEPSPWQHAQWQPHFGLGVFPHNDASRQPQLVNIPNCSLGKNDCAYLIASFFFGGGVHQRSKLDFGMFGVLWRSTAATPIPASLLLTRWYLQAIFQETLKRQSAIG